MTVAMHKLSVVMILLVGGVVSAAPKPSPKLTFGKPTVTGTLDAKAVAAVVKRSATKLVACYKKALASDAALEGTATATFTIGADGKVTAAAATGLGEDVERCVAATISKIKFAKPKDGAP